MKNLNLDAYGVEEMNAGEMKETSGGIAPLVLAAWGVMIACDAVCIGLGYYSNKNKN